MINSVLVGLRLRVRNQMELQGTKEIIFSTLLPNIMCFHTYSIKIKLKYQMIVINLHNQGEAIALEKYGCQGARY